MDFAEDFRRLRTLGKSGLAARVEGPFVGQLFKKVNFSFPALENGELAAAPVDWPAPSPSPSPLAPPRSAPVWPKGNDLIQAEDLVEGQGVLVAFVAETPKDFGGPGEGGLLSRMIGALPFAPGEAVRILFDRDRAREDILRAIGRHVWELSPRAIVTVGAYATNLCLGRKERLSLVHGKELALSWQIPGGQTAAFPCFPIFHPDYLQINPNMKRTAWADLQRVAEFLRKKISD